MRGGGGRRNSPAQKNFKRFLRRHSALQEGTAELPLPQCGLAAVPLFRSAWCRKGAKEPLYSGEPDRHHLHLVIKVNVSSNKSCALYMT